MVGAQDILPLIYHETQQSGSLLCAQHALNSLLQGNYFTAPDLSELAHHIDNLEQSYNESIRGQASANMDDTGFFSVQVLENALQVWGLSLVRWRSEAMKPYYSRPHTQLAFVLNQNQHWYTLRRFGSPVERSYWFDLDSSKASPEWISKTYLGMFLQQAEHEGYSIFAVAPIDPANTRPLPQCDADDAASALSEPSAASSSGSRISSSNAGFEGEDIDLQAALQASLVSTERGGSTSSSGPFNGLDTYPSPVIPSSRAFPGFPPELTSSGGGRPNVLLNQDPYSNTHVDPVTASMERNRIIMERMRQEQEEALREQYEEDIARFGPAQERRLRQRREADVEVEVGDEDELFRRAMEESLAEHHARTGDDVEMTELDEGDYDAPAARPITHTMDRVYDDDDAELQAALKASLESVPPGFTLPPSAPLQPPQRLMNEPSRTNTDQIMEESRAGNETKAETETETEGVSSGTTQVPREELSIEEIRRRRLARFGG